MSSSSSWQHIPLNHHFLTHSTFENFLCLKECSLLFLFDFFPTNKVKNLCAFSVKAFLLDWRNSQYKDNGLSSFQLFSLPDLFQIPTAHDWVCLCIYFLVVLFGRIDFSVCICLLLSACIPMCTCSGASVCVWVMIPFIPSCSVHPHRK